MFYFAIFLKMNILMLLLSVYMLDFWITFLGYGTISPVTIYGKAFCIFLVAVGIPMNVILVSVLASLCMPIIRKSRNALVDFYSYSSDHDTYHNKHNKNWKHSNFNSLSGHRKSMEDIKPCLNKENKHRVSKLFFKLKSLFRRQVNAPDGRSESTVLHRSLSDRLVCCFTDQLNFYISTNLFKIYIYSRILNHTVSNCYLNNTNFWLDRWKFIYTLEFRNVN